MKKLSDVGSKDVVKDKECNMLNRKVNNLEKEMPVGSNLIHINQYDTGNYNLEKKNNDVDKKLPDGGSLVTTTVLNIKLKKYRTKYKIIVVY